MSKSNFGLWPICWTIIFTCSHKMFEVYYFGGKYKRSAAPLMSSIVLKSSIKSCFDGVAFEDAAIIYISGLNFCFTGNLLMLYCCKDCKNVIRDKEYFQSRHCCLFFRPLQGLSWNISKFFRLRTKKFHSPKYKKIFQGVFFFFFFFFFFHFFETSRNLRKVPFPENFFRADF